MRKIALEEHFVVPEFREYGKKMGLGAPPETVAKWIAQMSDLGEGRIAAMDEGGVDFMVLSMTSPGVQLEPDAEKAKRLARLANDRLAEAVRAHPTRFGGFAHLALQDPEAAADELERAVRELGFLGTMVNGHTNGSYLDEDRYAPFWERAQALDVPVYIHPQNSFDHPLMYQGHEELIGATWSWGVETGTHALRLVFGGTFERFPKARVILGHMGEMIPFFLARLDDRWRNHGDRGKLTVSPSETIKRNISITTTGVCQDSSLRCAIEAMGLENVMFSVDYPYEAIPEATRWIENAPLSDAERDAVGFDNAARILRLPAEVANRASMR